MQRILDELTGRLRKVYGDDLVSLVLYGSAAVGDHAGRFSDINILCVLRQVTPRELEAVEPVFRWWREKENPAPLLLSSDEVRTSTDCFPMEFHDIKERHRILYGEDVVAGLEIDDSFYRAQVEYQLRAMVLRLRQKGAGVLQDRDLLVRLLADSVSTFCVLTRHALRLCGFEAPFPKRDIVRQASTSFGLDASGFLSLLDFRDGKIKARELKPRACYEQYLSQVQIVVDAVDRLDK